MHKKNREPTSERKYDQHHELAHLYSVAFPTLCLMSKSKATNTKPWVRNPHHVTEFKVQLVMTGYYSKQINNGLETLLIYMYI